MYGPGRPFFSGTIANIESWLRPLADWVESRIGLLNATSSQTIRNDIYYVRVDTTSGDVTITLPYATGHAGKQITVEKISSDGNTLTLGRLGSDTINGAATQTLTAQYGFWTVIANGDTAWEIISTNTGTMTYPGTGIPVSTGSAWATSITNSSTVGQTLRVTGASTYAFGALDLADTDAVTGILPAANVAAPGSTTQVIFNDAGALAGDAGLVFNKTTNNLTVGTITDSALTAGRVVFAGTAGLLDDDAGFTFNDSTKSMTLGGNVAGAVTLGVSNSNTAADSTAHMSFVETSSSGGGFVFRAWSAATSTIGNLAEMSSTAIGTGIGTMGMAIYTQNSRTLGLGTVSQTTDLVIDTSHNVVLSTALRLTETGGGSDYVGFKAPAAITSSATYTLPSADGSAYSTGTTTSASDKVLTTDGSGTLSWTSKYWTRFNSAASGNNKAFDYMADVSPTSDVMRIGDQTAGPITPSGFAQLSVISRWGSQAIISTANTSHLSNAFVDVSTSGSLQSTSGIYIVTDHDSTQGGLNIGSYGAYVEARGSAGLTAALGVTWGMEVSPQNVSGTASVPIPSNYFPGGRNIAGILIQSAGSSSDTTYDSSAALVIGANTTSDSGTTAGSFVTGSSYEILTSGTTNFTLIGAANSNVGTRFTATGAGSGTGTAKLIVAVNKGIIFLDYSIATRSSAMEAIAMSANHQLTWTALGTTTPVGRLSSDGTHLTWASNGTTPKIKSPQFESTIATGTAPLVIASTTRVANLQSQYTWGLGSHAGSSDTTDPPNNVVFAYWNSGASALELWVDGTRVANISYPGAGSPSSFINN